MNRVNALKLAHREVGISRHVPITHLNSASIFETQQGMVGSVLKIKGIPFDTETPATLNQHQHGWHQALMALDERFCIYVTMHRHRVSSELQGHFNNAFAKELDTAYQSQFASRNLYTNDIYLTILYKGITTGRVGKGIKLFKQLQNKTIKTARSTQREFQIKQLTQAVQQLKATLVAFQPRILGEKDKAVGHSELLAFLSIVPNAGFKVSFKAPHHAMGPISHGIKANSKMVSLYPEGHLAQVLSAKQILFGRYIQFQGATPDDTHFAALITIKRYGTQSSAVMFDPLLKLDSTLISTHSFAMEAKDVALHKIRRHVIKMRSINDPAESQIDALHVAQDMLASDHLTMGYHHNTVMLLAESIPALETAINKTIKAYADAGFAAIKETLGQEPAFWAQVPGNLAYITRSSLISSRNFIDFCPLHNYRAGFRDKNHLGSAVTLLETLSRTPYFFNYHTQGSKDNPSKGHTMMTGGNNSGKTVTLCFLDAQMNRYGGRTFAFDRDRGMEIYIRASGGYYAILSPDHADSIAFNPLQLDDTPKNRQFCLDWLAQLVKKEQETTLDAELLSPLRDCIHYAFDQLAKEHRQLSNIIKLIPIDYPRWASLRRWLKADNDHPAGEYAYLFDNPDDKLNLHDKMGFDLTHFLDHEPRTILTPVMMYLFHRIEQSLDGTLTSILLDEGWQYLDNPYWQTKLKKWLPTLRKLNCHVVLATQSPASIVESPIKHVFLDNCATQLYFANPQARKEHYIDGLNLTESEFTAIKNNHPNSRLFLVKQEHESALCRVNLGQMPDTLAVLSANKKTVSLLDSIRSEVGDDPTNWLPIFHERRKML